jgi:hypothetical protein
MRVQFGGHPEGCRYKVNHTALETSTEAGTGVREVRILPDANAIAHAAAAEFQYEPRRPAQLIRSKTDRVLSFVDGAAARRLESPTK